MANLPLLAGILKVLGFMKQMCYFFWIELFPLLVSDLAGIHSSVKGPVALLMKPLPLGW